MKVHGFEPLMCPLDTKPLLTNPEGWQCEQGHQFDRAKQGYVNLLPVQYKKSLQPGDSKSMVRARSCFLDSGHYAPVAFALNKIVLDHLEEGGTYLDAGCGEGYYLNSFAHVAEADSTLKKVSVLGLDISKWAIQAAAKRTKNVQWVVGSNAHLPVADATFDVVSVVFGFPVYEEFARVLKPLGLLIVVEPTAHHLHELRTLIYPSVKEMERPEVSPRLGFKVKGTQNIHFQINVHNNEDILNLLAMTPHVHRITPNALEKLKLLQQLTVTVDMQCTLYTRIATL